MGVRHHHGHRGAAAAGAGTGDIMGRLAWRHGRSRAPFRPWRAVHRPRVHHRGRGIRHASLDRHGRRLVRQRHGRERRRRVQDRARLATQALPGFEGPGIGDVPVGLVVGARSVCTGPWATGHRNGPKPSIMQTKRRKPPHYKGGTKIRPYHVTVFEADFCRVINASPQTCRGHRHPNRPPEPGHPHGHRTPHDPHHRQQVHS